MRSALILIMLFMSNTAIANPELAKTIKENVLHNLKYMQEEDSSKAMSTIHSQSPSYLSTKNILSQIFSNYKLSYKLVSFKFIAHHDDLVYARVKQATKKISGPVFQNNIIDMVQVFKQESGIWKLWAQANIGIKYIE
jgi:hypothetical protein